MITFVNKEDFLLGSNSSESLLFTSIFLVFNVTSLFIVSAQVYPRRFCINYCTVNTLLCAE